MTTIPETELADRLLDVAERPETSMSDRDVLVAAAESYDSMRARLAEAHDAVAEADAAKAQVASMHEALQDMHARMYGIALILKR